MMFETSKRRVTFLTLMYIYIVKYFNVRKVARKRKCWTSLTFHVYARHSIYCICFIYVRKTHVGTHVEITRHWKSKVWYAQNQHDGKRCAQIKDQLDQWQSGKLGTGSRVQSFPRAFSSSSVVPGFLLLRSFTLHREQVLRMIPVPCPGHFIARAVFPSYQDNKSGSSSGSNWN